MTVDDFSGKLPGLFKPDTGPLRDAASDPIAIIASSEDRESLRYGALQIVHGALEHRNSAHWKVDVVEHEPSLTGVRYTSTDGLGRSTVEVTYDEDTTNWRLSHERVDIGETGYTVEKHDCDIGNDGAVEIARRVKVSQMLGRAVIDEITTIEPYSASTWKSGLTEIATDIGLPPITNMHQELA